MDRVEKSWQSKGLSAYSTQALLGTLAHYGVNVDEKGFLAEAQALYPARIAEKWHDNWKGTGQFSNFPEAASEELFKRLLPDKLPPSMFSLAVAELIGSLEGKKKTLSASDKAARYEAVERMLRQVPVTAGKLSAAFMEEVVFHLDTFWERFNHLAENLAKEGQAAEAERFASLEETLFPERKGVSRAVVKAVLGDRSSAVMGLESIASNDGNDTEHRLSAVDALLHLEAFDEAKKQALSVMEKAEKAGDFHAGLDAASRLDYVFETKGVTPEDEGLVARIDALIDAHNKAHPHHH